MQPWHWSPRNERAIGLLTLAVLVVLAWAYYLERTACFDSAWFSWLMIDAGEPQSALGRYASWTSQLLPVWLIHQEAPLGAVLRAYSLCLVLVHVVLFAVVAWWLCDERATVALPLTLVTGLQLMFYYGSSELNQGLSFTVLVWVLLRRTLEAERNVKAWSAVLVGVNIWTSFHHQVLLLPLLFILGLELVRRRFRPDLRFGLLALALVGWYVVRIKLMAGSSYEQQRMPGSADVIDNIGRLDELASTRYLAEQFGRFKAYMLLGAVTMVLLALRRSWWRITWLVVWTVGAVLLILVTDRDQRSPVLFENFYPLPALVLSITFADVLVELSGAWRRRAGLACAVIMVLGMVQVHRAHHPFSAKVAHAQELTRQLRSEGVRKAIGSSASLPWAVVYSHWALAFETALISGIDGPTDAVTVFVDDDLSRYEAPMQARGAFLGPTWEPVWFGSQNLRKRYFDLPDEGYTLITHQRYAGDPHPGDKDVSLAPVEPEVWMPPSPVAYTHIRMRSHGGMYVPALNEHGTAVMLMARTYALDDETTPLTEDRTPMERDLRPGATFEQGLIIGRPHEPGRYRVEVELEVAGRPTGIRTSFVAEARRFGL